MRVERREADCAGLADGIVDAGLFEPAFGFGGFEFEPGDGLDGVAAGEDGEVFGVKVLVDGVCAGEGAVGFFMYVTY